MSTITVEIRDNAVFNLLHILEQMHVLRILNKPQEVSSKQKLSERFSGCLSSARTEELQAELIQMRNEWE
jgi:hypothetical protein